MLLLSALPGCTCIRWLLAPRSKTARIFMAASDFLTVLKFFGELDLDVRWPRGLARVHGVLRVVL
jgi:hypothetical protein